MANSLPVPIGGVFSFPASKEVENSEVGGPATTDVLAPAVACARAQALHPPSGTQTDARGGSLHVLRMICAASGIDDVKRPSRWSSMQSRYLARISSRRLKAS